GRPRRQRPGAGAGSAEARHAGEARPEPDGLPGQPRQRVAAGRLGGSRGRGRPGGLGGRRRRAELGGGAVRGGGQRFALTGPGLAGRTHPPHGKATHGTDRAPAGSLGGNARLSAISMRENRTVKRTVIVTAGVLALGLALYVGNKLWAQPAGANPQ